MSDLLQPGNDPAAENSPRRRTRMERLHGAEPQSAPQQPAAEPRPQQTRTLPPQNPKTVVNRAGDAGQTQERPAALFGPGTRPPRQMPVNTSAQGVPQPAVLRSRQEQPTGGSFGTRRTTAAQPARTSPQLAESQTRQLQQTMTRDPYEGQRPRRKTSRWPLVVVSVLLILALAVVGILLIPDDAEGLPGTIKRQAASLLNLAPKVTQAPPPEADSFTAAPTSGTAPMTVTFNLTTRGQAESVRVVDGSGNPLQTTVIPLQNADSSIWTMNLALQSGYNGQVQAQLMYNGEWQDTGRTVTLQIAEPEITQPVAAPTDPTPQAVDLSTTNNLSGAAPLTIDFTVTTVGQVEDVRLVDDSGEELDARAILAVPGASERVWMMTLQMTAPYQGDVHVEVLSDGLWMSTGLSRTLEITGAAGAQALPTQTVEAAPSAAVETTATPAPTQYIATLSPTDTPAPAQRQGLSALALPEEEPWEPEPETPAEEEPETPEAPETVSDSPAETGAPETQPDATPEPTEVPRLTAVADPSADPKLIKTASIFEGTAKKALSQYQRAERDRIDLPDADHYTRAPIGVLTFRGSSFRQNAACGTLAAPATAMSVKWSREMSSLKSSGNTVYYGSEYPSQPAIIQWSSEVRALTGMNEEKKATQALREVIVGGDDGQIYFLDLNDGEDTRNPIVVGYPLRGAPAVSANGMPFLAVGQYARKMASGTGKTGLRTFNMLTGKAIELYDGLDGTLNRPFSEIGYFNTSPIYDKNSDTMLAAGTNGMLYITRLNSELSLTTSTYSVGKGASLASQTVMLATKASGEADKLTAVESSLAGYQQYVFYADMGGYLRCVDTDTMTCVWALATGDAVQAAVALDLDAEGRLWLYTATTLQNRSKGSCAIRCINAMTGAVRWTVEVPVAKPKNNPYIAGVMASPVIGRGQLDDRVYFAVNGLSAAGAEQLGLGGNAVAGALISLNKEDGRLLAAEEMDTWCYASPVAVYTEDGAGQLIQADSDGKLRLMDPETLNTVSALTLEGQITASPAVFRDTLVICTTGKGTSAIYGIHLE